MATKGLFNLNLDERKPRGFLTSELKLWQPRGFSTLIWQKGTKGHFILRIGAVVTKGLFNLDLTKGNQGAFQPWNRSYWNVYQRAFLLRSEFLPAKSQNLGLDFKWWGLYGPIVFEMCDFHLFLFYLNFSLALKPWQIFVVPWKIFYLWSLKFGIRRLRLGIWSLKLGIEKLKFGIENLMSRHCDCVVMCFCWNLGHCMIVHVVILALGLFLNCCIFWHGVTWTMLVSHEFWQCWQFVMLLNEL